MRARHVIESERWIDMKSQKSFDNVDELFAMGMSAAKLGDIPRATTVLGLLQKADAPGQDAGLREQAAILVQEMEALIAMAEGRTRDAIGAMAIATTLQSRMPKPIGRPYPVKGADELYGEILLQAGRPKDAVLWFERTLTRTPNRSRAVLGLARAAAKAGETIKSQRAYRQFAANWRQSDPDLPEMAEARRALAR
jgi:predicted Zn-dependent protease